MSSHPRLILIAGLHGAGKSTFIRQQNYHDFLILDDVMADAYGDRPVFSNCRHRQLLLEALQQGKSLVLADVRFCEASFRQDFFSDIKNLVGSYDIIWHCFKPDLKACRINILHRAQIGPWNHVRTEEANNRKLSECYTYPEGATLHPVIEARKHAGLAASLTRKFFYLKKILLNLSGSSTCFYLME
jgi:hypothetical protein